MHIENYPNLKKSLSGNCMFVLLIAASAASLKADREERPGTPTAEVMINN